MRLLFLSFLALWVGCRSQASKLQIDFVANRQGEIEPCGCQTGQIGGLDRLAHYLKAPEKGAKQVFVSSGDAFFAFSSLSNPATKKEQVEKAKLIARAYNKMGMDFFIPGEKDFAGGVKLLNELRTLSGARFIGTNMKVTGSTLPLETSAVVKLGKKRLLVVGLADPQSYSGLKNVTVSPPASSLQKELKRLNKKDSDLVLLLSHLGLEQDEQIAATGLIDFVIGSHSLDITAAPIRVGKALIAQTDVEGKQVGRFLIDFKDSKQSSFSLVDLSEKYQKTNAVTKLMEEHKEKIRQLAFAKKAPVAKRPENAFVAHPFQCRTCHQAQYDFWADTKHASAYLVLFSKNQHFNPECIGCHSLGFEDPLGFSKIARPITLDPPANLPKGEVFVEKLMNEVFGDEIKNGPLDSRVQPKRHAKLKARYKQAIHKLEKDERIKNIHIGVQCEHCHQNRHSHPGKRRNIQARVPASSCTQCHTTGHDDNFNFKKDVKIVACPLTKKY